MDKKIKFLSSILITIFLVLSSFSKIVTASKNDIDYEVINAQIVQNVKENHIPGMAVCVVDKDGVIFEETYGNCTSVDQPFIIGSMSKSFTALAIMQLVEEGNIDLDAPISDYIDASEWFVNSADCDLITVKDLLNQTSGITTYQTFGNLKRTDSYGTHIYANVNYGLLGLIIESVSGVSYEEYIAENIFIPLEMDHSSASLKKARENGLIDGYRNYFGVPIAGEPDFPDEIHNGTWTNIPAGYLASSCADMGRYMQMYLNDGEGIVSRESINAMFYDNVPVNGGEYYYGMGWQYTETEFSKPILWHAGLVENYTSNMFIIPEEGKAIIVLVNMNDYLVTNNILGNIVMPLLGESRKDLPNLYLILHIVIDIICVLLLAMSIYSVKRAFNNKMNGKKTVIPDCIIYIIVPSILLCIPLIMSTPACVIWLFAQDIFIVIYSCTFILIVAAICRIVRLIIRFRKSK